MQKKVIIGLLLGGAILSLRANHLSFINKDFDTFCKQIIPELERTKFSHYYRDVEQKLTVSNKNDQSKRRHALYERAIHALHQEHKLWADTITSFLTDLQFFDVAYDQERDDVRIFLERYGAYKEYEQNNGLITVQTNVGSPEYFWNNVKVQVTKITEKIGNWFKSLRA